jgi:hypothetical protein
LATDKDEPLFKVAIVPIETEETNENPTTPFKQALALPSFAMIVSMNHTLGDEHTYYKLYSMLRKRSLGNLIRLIQPRFQTWKRKKWRILLHLFDPVRGKG